MATSSKYVQLSSSVLMEYVYADQEQINEIGNPYRISTVNAPIWKMNNAHSKQPQIMNADSAEIIQDGLPIGTGNVRNRSFGAILPYKGALLDINRLIFYNDYDSNLTPTASLPINFVSPKSPVYDTIKLHLIQGFNFEDNEGFILSIKVKTKSGATIVLANLSYNKEDQFEILNPSPFFFGGKIYDSYVEIRVLALYNLIYDYWLGILDGDTVVEKITNGDGVARDQMIQVFFGWVREKKSIDDQDYIEISDVKTIDLTVRDQFEVISAKIEESSDGDYIEFYATYGGNIIENYIIDLNNSGYDFILLHDLTISEYIYDPVSATYSWVKTDDLQISQTGDYDSPNLYRPVIKNSSAISFKIDYVVRLYDRNTSSQVWKTSSMISSSVGKYGKIIRSINLGDNPTQTKIYNQNVIKDISINKVTDPILVSTKYITSLSSNSNISITSDTVNPAPIVPGSNTRVSQDTVLQNDGSANLQVYSNGLGRIFIPDSVSFLRFSIYQKNNGQNVRMNLSGLGDLYIVFEDSMGDFLEYKEYVNPYTSKSDGEVVFRLSEKESKSILALSSRVFKIYLENDAGDRTFLYSGNYYSVAEYQDLAKNNRIIELEDQNAELIAQLAAIRSTISTRVGVTDQNGRFINFTEFFEPTFFDPNSLVPSSWADMNNNFNPDLNSPFDINLTNNAGNLKNTPATNFIPGPSSWSEMNSNFDPNTNSFLDNNQNDDYRPRPTN